MKSNNFRIWKQFGIYNQIDNENVLHSCLETKNCSTYVLSEAKLSKGRFMRLGQFYPMAHFSFVCKKNQTIKLEISFGCIQFWIDIEQ